MRGFTLPGSLLHKVSRRWPSMHRPQIDGPCGTYERKSMLAQMWRVVLDPQVSDYAIIRAASAIASTTSSDPRWERVASKLVIAVLKQTSLTLGEWLEELRPLAGVLAGRLADFAVDPEATQADRNSAVVALTGFSYSPTVLVPVLIRLDGHLFDVVLRKIDEMSSRGAAITLLKKNAKASVLLALESEPRFDHARATAALVRLGELEELDRVLDDSTPPSVLAKVLELMSIASVDILCRGLRQSESSNALRLFLLGLTSRAKSDFSETETSDASLIVQNIYASHLDASVHAAADLLLRRWGIPSSMGGEGRLTGQTWQCLEMSGINLTFVHFKAGQFTMGSPRDERRREGDEVLHEVRITRPFAMLDRPVSVGQLALFRAAMGQSIDTNDLSSATAAVDVSWLEAQQFCSWLNDLLVRDANLTYGDLSFRLPAEAEWEYACRSGSSTAFEFGGKEDLLSEYGWFEDNSEGGPMPVATKLPSSAGLFDMHGNVYEWCLDWYGPYNLAESVDPMGPKSGDRRVVRGGCWFFDSRFCRSAYRGDTRAPNEGYNDLGFRIVLARPLGMERMSGA
jgi:formylglycine-generating enzyme required for sulfatase activity